MCFLGFSVEVGPVRADYESWDLGARLGQRPGGGNGADTASPTGGRRVWLVIAAPEGEKNPDSDHRRCDGGPELDRHARTRAAGGLIGGVRCQLPVHGSEDAGRWSLWIGLDDIEAALMWRLRWP